MNPLTLLRNHQADAELDAAVWVDDQPLLRRAVATLAHHRVLRAVALALATPAIAVAATAWAVRETGRVIVRAHEVAGEGTAPCRPCINREADEFARSGVLTYTDVCNEWDLADGGLT